MKRAVKGGIAVLLGLAVLGGLSTLGLLLFTGPLMREQPSIRAHQAVFPPMPKGAVPVAEAPSAAAPLEGEAALAAGQVYYGYYCTFCHGGAGDGRGPVGESYIPVPADLRSQKIRGYSDEELERAMLTGTGHGDVLRRVVRPTYRGPLVLYVRQLQGR